MAETPLSGLSLSSGWLLIVADGCEHRIIHAESLARLSVSCEVIACSIEARYVQFFRMFGGRSSVWRVEHNAQESVRHLSLRATCQTTLMSLRKRVEIEQVEEDRSAAEVDYFCDVPLHPTPFNPPR